MRMGIGEVVDKLWKTQLLAVSGFFLLCLLFFFFADGEYKFRNDFVFNQIPILV